MTGIVLGAIGALFALFSARYLRPLSKEESDDLPRVMVVLDKVGYWLWLGPWMVLYAIMVAAMIAQSLGYR